MADGSTNMFVTDSWDDVLEELLCTTRLLINAAQKARLQNLRRRWWVRPSVKIESKVEKRTWIAFVDVVPG